MRPLILNYFETLISEVEMKIETLEYNERLQLSVFKGTETCAFEKMDLATRTMTKAQGESSDDDDNGGMSFVNFHVGTITYSAINDETSDSDVEKPQMQNLLGTVTATRMQRELSDNDK